MPPPLRESLNQSLLAKPLWRVFALLAIGVVLFAFNPDFVIGRGHGIFGSRPQYIAAILLAALAIFPAISRPLSRALDKLRTPSRKARIITAAILFVLSAQYFLLSANLANRPLFPKFHDEFMYLLQAQMLARGRLWMPPHPLGEFFDSFFVIVKPVYAGSYFPGTALFNVPGVWLNLAPYVTGVMIAALCVTMLYLVATEMIDGLAGILAALLAISLEQLRVVSVMTMSHSAMFLLFLLAIWSYLHWRKNQKITWAIALGIFSGWSAITRPLDAVCLVLPICIALLWHLRSQTPKRAAITLIAIIAGALPFLSLQLILDKGTTGHFLQTPITTYGNINTPALEFNFHPYTGPLDSPSPLPQVRDYYRDFIGPFLREHGTHGFFKTWITLRWEPAATVSLPAHLLFILLPLSLLAIRRPAAGALLAGLLIFPLAFTFYPTYLNHYALVGAPAYILLLLLGANQLQKYFPSTAAPIAIFIATIAIGALPELHASQDHFMQAPYLADINTKLANLPHTPAVVLFHYESNKADIHEEPVFNIDTPWPDDAEVIRAHDLGPEKNQQIYNYYAARQPSRFFYIYDRATAQLNELGWAKDLAEKNK